MNVLHSIHINLVHERGKQRERYTGTKLFSEMVTDKKSKTS